MRPQAGSLHPLALGLLALTAAAVSCHKETSKAPDDDGCLGARCVEEAEAALWEGDPAAAREPLRLLCDEKDGFSCFRLAELYQEGRGGPKDLDQAAGYFERACLHQHEEGCERRVELALDLGVGDREVAMEYALKACDGGRRRGCMTAGDLAVELKDNERAAELYEKACGLGEAPGCTRAGDLLFDPKGSSYTKGRALAAYNSACVGYEGHGCLQLAIAIFMGIGTEASAERALVQFKHACELGVDDGCVNERRLAAAKNASLLLTSESPEITASGLVARDLRCQMEAFGDAGLTAALEPVARHRRKLHECVKSGGAAVAIRWTFEKGKIQGVQSGGPEGKRYVGCVAKELRTKGARGSGSCSAFLLLGDTEAAIASLPAKEPAPAPAATDAADTRSRGRSGSSGLVKPGD